jgi:hypothetical protein
VGAERGGDGDDSLPALQLRHSHHRGVSYAGVPCSSSAASSSEMRSCFAMRLRRDELVGDRSAGRLELALYNLVGEGPQAFAQLPYLATHAPRAALRRRSAALLCPFGSVVPAVRARKTLRLAYIYLRSALLRSIGASNYAPPPPQSSTSSTTASRSLGSSRRGCGCGSERPVRRDAPFHR